MRFKCDVYYLDTKTGNHSETVKSYLTTDNRSKLKEMLEKDDYRFLEKDKDAIVMTKPVSETEVQIMVCYN